MDSVQQIFVTNQTPLSQTFRASYSAINRMIIVLKDTASYRVAKRIAPSLSLLTFIKD